VIIGRVSLEAALPNACPAIAPKVPDLAACPTAEVGSKTDASD